MGEAKYCIRPDWANKERREQSYFLYCMFSMRVPSGYMYLCSSRNITARRSPQEVRSPANKAMTANRARFTFQA